MGDLDYVYAVARIRVKEKSLLSDADMSQMAGLKDVKSVIGYLTDRGWGDTNTGNDPEAILKAEEEKTLAVMKELKVDSDVFDLLSLPNLYHNLKTGIKEICTSENNADAFFAHEQFGRDAILKILSEKNYKALPEHMREAAEREGVAIVVTPLCQYAASLALALPPGVR